MPGTHLLPPNLLKLFAPRPPLPYARPVDKDIDRVRGKRVTGVGSILMSLREANAMDASIDEEDKPSFTLAEEAKRQIRREATRRKKEEEFKGAQEAYKPADDPEAIGDPYKTLFISRLHKSATEADLRREFEGYGTIERVRMVRDKKGRSRGYAFIVYERERDMKAAYKESDGLHIMGKRILVDVERGRTVRGWKPRRLGGGLGGRPKKIVDQAPVGRPAFRGGFGGGYRGRGGGGGGGGRGYGGDRGGHGGDRGGHGGDRGGHGGDRGGFRGGGYGSFRSGRDEFGGGFRGRGRGLGYGGGGGGGGGYPDHTNGYGAGGGSGYGGPPGGNQGYGSHGGYSGGGGYYKRDGPPGYDDRDPKRPRY